METFDFFDTDLREVINCEFEIDDDGDPLLTKTVCKGLDLSGYINLMSDKDWQITQAFIAKAKQTQVDFQIDRFAEVSYG